MPTTRTRRDRCPGASRPWPASDGLLVRLRLIGGLVSSHALRALAAVADAHGDGRVHPTSRANLQLRALPGEDGRLAPGVLAALERTGLLPSATHELVRNVMASPATGLAGGRADLRAVAAELDDRICADPALAGLPARFLVVLDDGRGDLLDRAGDLGLVALDEREAQLRVGDAWGPVVPVADAAARLAGLAHAFTTARGSGPSAPWHVAELPTPLLPPAAADPRVPPPAPPLPFGDGPAGRHVAVPEDGLDAADVATLTAGVDAVVVTPWRGVLVPGGRS